MLPASCHPTRGRLRLSNCLPRWAPTGSLPGCSHAKWLQMRGMMRCWLRQKQNLPGNLTTWAHKQVKMLILLITFCSHIHGPSCIKQYKLKVPSKITFCSLNFHFIYLQTEDWRLMTVVLWKMSHLISHRIILHRNGTNNVSLSLNPDRQTTSEYIILDLLTVTQFYCTTV